MRKVFIDCGSHDGCSVRKFIDLYDKNLEYEYYCFEMNRDLEPFYEDLKEKVQNLTIFFKGVSALGGHHEMLRMGISGGSTIDEKKKKSLFDKQYNRADCMLFDFHQVRKSHQLRNETVETVRLSSWIRENFTKEDYIVVKMDIEGSEYDIIDDMVAESTWELVDWFEFEPHLQDQYNVSEFVQKVKNQNPEIKLELAWDAMHPPYLLNKKTEEFYAPYNFEHPNYRPPLSKSEKINFSLRFLTEHGINIEDCTDWPQKNFKPLKQLLNENDLIQEWKEYIWKIGIEEIF